MASACMFVFAICNDEPVLQIFLCSLSQYLFFLVAWCHRDSDITFEKCCGPIAHFTSTGTKGWHSESDEINLVLYCHQTQMIIFSSINSKNQK